MFEKLREASERYEEIESKLTDPDVIGDNAAYRSLMKERKTLTPIVETYRAFCVSQESFEEAEEITADSSYDAEFRAVAEEQKKHAKAEIDRKSVV